MLLMKIQYILLILTIILIVGCSENNSTKKITTETNSYTQTTDNTTDVNPNINTQTSNQDSTNNNQPVTQTNNTQTNIQSENKIQEAQSGISLSELAKHNSRSDCWIAYKGIVYDITSFLPKHPGGITTISPYCGTASEFENAFTKKHGTSQVNKLVKEGKNMGNLQ